jgi:ankyrin repeat protein
MEIVKALASAGADVNQATLDGATPLFVAAARGYTEVVRVLLAHGAACDRAPITRKVWGSKRLNIRTPPALVCPTFAQLKPRDTPLRVACEKGNLAVVRALLAAGADVHAGGGRPARKSSKTGQLRERDVSRVPEYRPLVFDAVHSYSTVIVTALMAKVTPSELLRVVGKAGAALLLGAACRHGHTAVVQLVLDSGVSPDGFDRPVKGPATHGGNGAGSSGESVVTQIRRSATVAGGFAATFAATTAPQPARLTAATVIAAAAAAEEEMVVVGDVPEPRQLFTTPVVPGGVAIGGVHAVAAANSNDGRTAPRQQRSNARATVLPTNTAGAIAMVDRIEEAELSTLTDSPMDIVTTLPNDPTNLGEWRDEVMLDARVVSAQSGRHGAQGNHRHRRQQTMIELHPAGAPTTRAGAVAAAGSRHRAGIVTQAPNHNELFEGVSDGSSDTEHSWHTHSHEGEEGWAPTEVPSVVTWMSASDGDVLEGMDWRTQMEMEDEFGNDGREDSGSTTSNRNGANAARRNRNSTTARHGGQGDGAAGSGGDRWGSDSEEDFWLPPEHDEETATLPHNEEADWGIDLSTPPLQTAIEAGEHELTALLLDAGARKGAVASLISACERSCVTSAKLLLTAGVDPNGLAPPPAASSINPSDPDSRIRPSIAPVAITPLLAALSDRASWECSPSARHAVVDLLLRAGAGPNQAVLFPSTASRGLSHLFGVKRAKKLTRELAGTNGEPRAAAVYPLVCACAAGDQEIVELLFSKGATLQTATDNTERGKALAVISTPRRAAFDPMLEACRRKGVTSIELVQLLRKKGGDVNSVFDQHGRTPLHIAAAAGAPKLVRFLLKECGAKVDECTDDLQLTPLAMACRCDHVSPGVVKALLKAGADVNHQSLDHGTIPPEAITPLASVCNRIPNGRERSAEAVIRMLLKHGADIEKATVPSGRTPLYVACQSGFDGAVKMVIAAGAEVDRPHPQTGATPLMAALHAQPAVSHAVIERLLGAGAAVTAVTKGGVTPLIVACGRNAVNAVNSLVKAGASLAQATHTGDTALSVACQTGHLAIAKELVLLGAGKVAVGGFERSPMYCACVNGWDRFAQFLMDDAELPEPKVAAFDSQGTDRNGRSLLHFAAGNEMLEVVEHLLHTSSVSTAASVTAVDADGATPLHFASRLYALGQADGAETESPHRVLVVRLLVEAGADVNAVTTARPGPSDEPDLVPTGVTPLFVATMRGDMGVSAVLRAADAVSLPTEIPVTVAPRAGYIPVMVSFGDGLASISLAELGWLKHSHGLIWPSRLCAFTGHGEDDAHGAGVTRQWIGMLGRQLLTCNSRKQASTLGMPALESLFDMRGEARPPTQKVLTWAVMEQLPSERHVILSCASNAGKSQDVQALLVGVGRALGLAICWRCSLGLALAPSFCKLLLGKEDEIGVEDLEYVLPAQQFQMLMECLDTKSSRKVRAVAVNAYTEAVSDDTMVTDSREYLRWEKETVEAQSTDGPSSVPKLTRAESELMPGGNKVRLTVGNIESFAKALAKKLLVTNLKEQISYVRRGLEDVYGATTVLAHLPEGWFSLYHLIRGAQKLDVDDWIEAVDCDFTPQNNAPCKLFWEGVRKLDDEQLRKLLHFWCAESPPVEGLKTLGLKLVVDQRDGACLLQAATCFSLLKIPNTTSEAAMTKAILAGVAHWNLLDRG